MFVLTPRGRGLLVDKFLILGGPVDEAVGSKTDGTGDKEAVPVLDIVEAVSSKVRWER